MIYRFLPFLAFSMEATLIWSLLRVWKRRSAHRFLLLYLTTTAVWALLVAGLRESPTLSAALTWEKLIFPLIPLMSLSLFHFCVAFTGEGRPRGPLIGVYVLNVSAFVLSFTPLVLQGVQMRSYGYAPIVGPLASVWFASILIPPMWGLLLLWRFYAASHSSEQRNRTLYLLVALGFLIIGGLSDWLAGIGRFPYPLGMVGHLILSALITVAVVRYRLFDVRPYFYSVVSYFMAGGTIVAAYAGLWITLNDIWGLRAIFLMAPLGLVLFPATRRFQEALTASLNRRKFHNEKLLEDFAKDASKILDLNHLASRLTGLVATIMTAEPVHLYLYNTERKVLEPIASTAPDLHSFPSFPESSLLASRLKAIDRTLTTREFLSDQVLQFLTDEERQVLDKLKGQLFFPLKSQHRLVGMLVLGEKASWESYNLREIGLLNKVTQQVAVVLDNARLYDDARRARDNLETWLNSMSDSVVIIGADQSIQFMNSTASRIFGGPGSELSRELLVANEGILSNPAPGGKVEGARRTVKVKDRLYDMSAAPLVNPDGSTSIIEVLRDITERERAEEERRDVERKAQIASRLATVGEMASGIAHEINNPLTGVIGFAGLMINEDMSEEHKKYIKIINNGAERVAAIVRRLLAFARQQKPERRAVVINEILATTVELRSYQMKTNNISMITRFDPELPPTVADGGQLQQVFLNIIINAEKEMKQAHDKGTLIIKTERTADRIIISFKDDGPGIAPQNLDKLFTPFFSTRKVGEGAGLGLSVCWGIIAEHNGKIYAQSPPGGGATFIVELPIVTGTVDSEIPLPAKQGPESLVVGKILAVDDNLEVQEFLHKVLAGAGHTVSTVDEALRALENLSRETYDLIMIDVKLPGMSGIDLYRRLKEIPGARSIPVIFITGDVMASDTREFLDITPVPYLTKPFEIPDLLQCVDRTLAAAAALYPSLDKRR